VLVRNWPIVRSARRPVVRTDHAREPDEDQVGDMYSEMRTGRVYTSGPHGMYQLIK